MKKIYSSIIFFFIITSVFSQGWENYYRTTSGDVGEAIQASDGSIYILEYDYIWGYGGLAASKVYIDKLDSKGNITTSKYIDSISGWSFDSFTKAYNGGYLLYNEENLSGNPIVVRLDSAFNIKWTNSSGLYFNDCEYTSKGKYFIINGGISALNDQGKTVSINSNYWKTFTGSIYDIEPDSARTNFFLTGKNGLNIWVAKIDSSGDTLWTNKFGKSDVGTKILPYPGGGYLLATQNKALIKLNSNGDSLGTISINNTNFKKIAYYNNYYYLLYGNYFIKMDKNGNIQWSHTFPLVGETSANSSTEIIPTLDNGCLVMPCTTFAAGASAYGIKVDSLGKMYSNSYNGSLFVDANSNCQRDAGEVGIAGAILVAKPGDNFAFTDANGNYSLDLDTGITYTVYPVVWDSVFTAQSCFPYTYNILFKTTEKDSINNNFPFIQLNCPFLEVKVESWGYLRRCYDNTHTVFYKNEGPLAAENIKIDVTFPPQIILKNAYTQNGNTISWVNNQNVYTFTIGTINPHSEGYFYIWDSIACSSPVGSAGCVEAVIYPDTNCIPANPSWDKSNITVTGACMGDSIAKFIITNNGANMTDSSQYRLYADDILVIEANFKLDSGTTKEIDLYAEGKSLRIEADQRPGHPGLSRPRAFVEGCGNTNGVKDYGYVTSVVQDDEAPGIDIDCAVIVDSYDPNEKIVSPSGITAQHFVNPKNDLEYSIYFQNTGSAAAKNITVVDTLDPSLDFTTFHDMISSDSCTYSVQGQNPLVIQWVFKNINLPTEATSETASKAFVSFKIKPKADVAKGTIIDNKAYINFDFNPAVITNIIEVTANDTTLTGNTTLQVLGLIPQTFSNVKVNVYPNPFSDKLTVTVSTGMPYVFSLYDLSGREIKTINSSNSVLQISRGNLVSGIYFYKIIAQEALLGVGKLIAE